MAEEHTQAPPEGRMPPPPGASVAEMAAFIPAPAAPPFIPLGGIGGGEKFPAPASITALIPMRSNSHLLEPAVLSTNAVRHASTPTTAHHSPSAVWSEASLPVPSPANTGEYAPSAAMEIYGTPASPPSTPYPPDMPTWPDSGFVLPPDFPSADWLFDQPAAPDHPSYPPQNPPNPPWTPDSPLLPPPAWPQAPPVPVGAQPPAPPSLPDFPNLAMDNYYGDSYDWEGGDDEQDVLGTMRVMSVVDGVGQREVLNPADMDPADAQQQTGLIEGLRPVLRPHGGHVNGGGHRFTSHIPPHQESHLLNVALSSTIGIVALMVMALAAYHHRQKRSLLARYRGLHAMDRQDLESVFESAVQYDEECQPLTERKAAYGTS